MLKIEFNKILKRRFNYLFLFVTTVLLIFLQYKRKDLEAYLSISSDEFFYNYNFKFILLLIFIYSILNIILSYRKDYKDSVNFLIQYSKKSRFTNLLSKLLVNYICSSIMYIFLLAIVIFPKNIDIFKSSFKYYIVLSMMLMFFVANLALVMVVIFNKATVALASTTLILTSLSFVREFLKRYYDIIFNDIFSLSFERLSVEINNVYNTSIWLLVYSVAIFIISVILKATKDN